MTIHRRDFLYGASAAALTLAAPAHAASPAMTVTKSPICGCCTAWAEIAVRAGYDVTPIDVDDITEIKLRLGVPEDLWGCHTAEVDGYVVEGHVPAEHVARILEERPAARGL